MKPSTKIAQLTQIIAPAVAACDVVLWGIEFMPQGKRSLLRIYIETPPNQQAKQHVTIEDCAAVTHQVSGVLEVHDPIAGEYVLEVSSPGLDRPFFLPEQMQPYIQSMIQLRLIRPVQDEQIKRRKITGRLQQATAHELSVITDDGKQFDVKIDNVDKAHLIYEDSDKDKQA